MSKFKVGDVVKVVPPNGKVFSVLESDFRGGIVPAMVKMVDKKNEFTIISADDSRETVRFAEGYVWDKRWLKHIDKEDGSQRKVVSVDFIISDKQTKAVDLHRVGVTTKNPNDKHDERIAMIVSLARMLGLPNHKVEGIIDVLWDDVPKGLEEATVGELIKELSKRI